MTDTLLQASGLSVDVHCSCCGRKLTDRVSIADRLGPDCLEKLQGHPRRQYARRGAPSQDQPPLPLDGLTEPEPLNPSSWPCWTVSGVVVCGQGRCGAVLLEIPGPWTTGDVETAIRRHAPHCAPTRPE